MSIQGQTIAELESFLLSHCQKKVGKLSSVSVTQRDDLPSGWKAYPDPALCGDDLRAFITSVYIAQRDFFLLPVD